MIEIYIKKGGYSKDGQLRVNFVAFDAIVSEDLMVPVSPTKG